MAESTWRRSPPPKLPANLQALLDDPWPRFSDAEMARRRAALESAMAARGVTHLLIYGAANSGTAVPWLTGWPVTTEAAVVMSSGVRDALYVQYYNHLPLARRETPNADVGWGGASTIATAAEEIRRRGGANGRIGVIGPLPFARRDDLAEATGAEIVNMMGDYVRLRLVKSAEELDWFRIGAALSDLAIDALLTELRPGLSERDLADIVERAYVPWGGRPGIHFFGVTSMADPDLEVPRQFASPRKVAAGDIVFTEITANFRDYGGQVLRSFAVGAEPTPLYRDLHAAAEAAFDAIVGCLRPGATPADIVAAGRVIEEAGFTICDDMVHGYGGGYLPPVLGLPSRREEPLPDLTLQAGMMMVVQPNVITKDGKAGVQTGECVLITETGAESLHAAPRGFLKL